MNAVVEPVQVNVSVTSGFPERINGEPIVRIPVNKANLHLMCGVGSEVFNDWKKVTKFVPQPRGYKVVATQRGKYGLTSHWNVINVYTEEAKEKQWFVLVLEAVK
jgi:hypothetical protein